MSRIDDAPDNRSVRSAPDSVEDSARAEGLSDPITARMEGAAVDEDIAPMLPDLLTRPEAISGGLEAGGVRPPRPTDAVDPPSPTEELQILRQVESKLDRAAGQLQEGNRAEAVERMLRSIQYFRSLREEVVMRAEV